MEGLVSMFPARLQEALSRSSWRRLRTVRDLFTCTLDSLGRIAFDFVSESPGRREPEEKDHKKVASQMQAALAIGSVPSMFAAVGSRPSRIRQMLNKKYL